MLDGPMGDECVDYRGGALSRARLVRVSLWLESVAAISTHEIGIEPSLFCYVRANIDADKKLR